MTPILTGRPDLRDLHGHDILDHRVAEQLVREALGLGEHRIRHLAVDGELEALADAHGAELGLAGSGEGPRHGLAGRVEQLGLRHDLDDDGGH